MYPTCNGCLSTPESSQVGDPQLQETNWQMTRDLYHVTDAVLLFPLLPSSCLSPVRYIERSMRSQHIWWKTVGHRVGEVTYVWKVTELQLLENSEHFSELY